MTTVTDFFCGMGGSSTGLVEAGYEVKVAANHWGRAIETHSANHPDTEHLCADISQIDLRYLPRTQMLWASPICTEISPAGGRQRKQQPDLFQEHGHVATEAFERTRVTFWEVIRATEIHRYDAVIVENVAESASQWELFPTWLHGMEVLGYNAQFVSVSAAHVGDGANPYAPQWRDRIYIVLTRKGIRLPDVNPRPLAWCERCDTDVAAVQWWKRPGTRFGKYRAQYIYVCPVGDHGQVEPYVAPAAAAIDWADLGERIGDRKRPLAAKTMKRIELGAHMIASGRFGFSMAHGGKAAPFDLAGEPMRTWTTGDTEAMALAPWVMGGMGDQLPRPIHEPHRWQRSSSADSLVVPPDAFITTMRRNGGAEHVSSPLHAFTAGGFHHSLVIPFRKGAAPHSMAEPQSTTATHSQHGVLHGHPEFDLDQFRFRMLRPREAANAQRFPRDYVIHGNQSEQQMQAGNAVAVNVAHWLGRQVAESLGVAA